MNPICASASPSVLASPRVAKLTMTTSAATATTNSPSRLHPPRMTEKVGATRFVGNLAYDILPTR
jgi:hypothetical protein